jgi:hypothetical protein
MGTTPANSFNQNSTSSGLQNWDGVATPSTTALVQYYVVSGASANTVNNIAPSTSGFVLTSNGGSAQPTFQAIPFTKMPWTDKAANFNAASQNGYFVTATAIATLPASPAQGDVVAFDVDVDPGTGLLTVTANTGQYIRVGKQISLSAGSMVNNFHGDSVTLVYRLSDTTWHAVPAPQGTWTVTTS